MKVSSQNKFILAGITILMVLSFVAFQLTNSIYIQTKATGFSYNSAISSDIDWFYNPDNSYAKSVIHRKEYSGSLKELELQYNTPDFANMTLGEFDGGDENITGTTHLMIPNQYLDGNLFILDTKTLEPTTIDLATFLERIQTAASVDFQISYPADGSQGYVSNFYLLN